MQGTTSDPGQIKYLDLDAGLSRIRGNKKLFHKMLGMFLDSEEFERLDEVVAKQDFSAAADVAHAIKGMSGNLSMGELFNKSSNLLSQLRGGMLDGNTLEEYRDALEKSKNEAKTVMEQLARQI